jgi:hypothetical protein
MLLPAIINVQVLVTDSDGRVSTNNSVVAVRTVLPASVAGYRIGRMTEAPYQPAYKRNRQKQILLPQELNCKQEAVGTRAYLASDLGY